MVDIRFERSGIRKGRSLLEKVARETLEKCCERFDQKNSMISVLFCSREKIRQLNRDFRSVDSETDILSFSAIDYPMGTESVIPETDDIYGGDLAVCVPYMVDDCKKEKEDISRHTVLLFVHGFLHLNGYDHDTKTREKKMFSLQNKIVDELRPHKDLTVLKQNQ